jgi:2-oxo-4-hydroxy-4-carboxy-5-ureidoimidazoline decarboxylase
MSERVIDVAWLDALPPAAARELLRPACASEAWLTAVVAGRPYPDAGALVDRSDAVLADVPWPEIERAIATHSRIGERAAGGDQESVWSREEQSAASSAGDDVAAALHRGNLEYERRFGHVFLICASGRSSDRILAALHERMDNDPLSERAVVRSELAAIVRLRLGRLLR